MRDGAREAVELPHAHDVEASPVRVGHEAIKLRTFLLRAAHADIDVLARDLPTAPLAIVAELGELHLGRLPTVAGADTRVDRDSRGHTSSRLAVSTMQMNRPVRGSAT